MKCVKSMSFKWNIKSNNYHQVLCLSYVYPFHFSYKKYFDNFQASWSVFILTSQERLLLWIKGTESCVGRTGKQKQKCCYGVGLKSSLYVSRYQTCVGKVCAVVIHPTSMLQSHFSMQYLISTIMSQEKSEQCFQ